MTSGFTKLLENIDGHFPELTAHQWCALGYSAIKTAMSTHLQFSDFENYGFAISERYSNKRKELLIAYNDVCRFELETRSEIITSVLAKHGIESNDGSDANAIFNSIVDSLESYGIKVKPNTAIPATKELFELEILQLRDIFIYNKVISEIEEHSKLRFKSREADRLKAGLRFCLKELAANSN